MRQLIPHFILDNFAAGVLSGSFSASGLFIDVSGFSTMTNALMTHGHHGAEVLAGVMRATFEPLMRSVFEQQGFIVSQEGDAFTALFPQVDEPSECAQRALEAARQIQQYAAQNALHSTPYGSFSVTVKAGLTFGSVNWGIITSSNGRLATFYFQGQAVDRAAESEHHAQAGDVMMDRDFYTLVRDFALTDLEAEYCRLLGVNAGLPAALPVEIPEIDLSLARHFLPEILFTQRHSGEFRQVACLFINLPTIRNDRQLRAFMQTTFELQEKYGGIFKLFFGDKGAYLLIFWGAITSLENDLERALDFVLEMQAQTAIPVKSGMTYQTAFTGFVGGPLAEEFSAYGRGTNLAARLMAAAPRGEIWVDQSVAKRAERKFNIEPAGEQAFKGFGNPQKVYVLYDRKENVETFFEGQMVGRIEEMARLENFAKPVFAGQNPGMMVVWGEPGQGKSRLVHEFVTRLEEQRTGEFQLFIGQTDEILRQPLNPFRYLLLRYFQIAEAQGETRNKRSFNRKLDELIRQTKDLDLADELDRTRSFLGALIGLYWPDSLYEQLDARGRYENTQTALAVLLQAESLRRPLILLLEDIHWLDDDSKTFMPYLLRSLVANDEVSYPMAILATARYQGAGLPLEGFPYHELFLPELERQSLAALTEGLLGSPAADGLLELLEERSQGNPFFIEQILRYLKEEGQLRQGPRGWTLQVGQAVAVPADVNILLVARLDRLTQDVKEIVQTASILGREFDLTLLTYMLQSIEGPNLSMKINSAEEEGIWTALNEIHYLFKHLLLRDAAYQMQLQARRKALHALALEAYEKRFAEGLDDHYGELSYHAENAGLKQKAYIYLHLAGKAAKDSYQLSAAANYFSRALALLDDEEADRRFDLLFEREAIYSTLGKTAEWKQDLAGLEALLPVLNNPRKTAEVLLRKTSHALDAGLHTEAIQFGIEAESLAQAANLPEHQVRACKLIMSILDRQGQAKQAIAKGEEALVLARRIGLQTEESRILNSLGMARLNQGDMNGAQECFIQSLELARAVGNLRDQALPFNNLGMIFGYHGDFDKAQDYYERALMLAERIGEISGKAINLGNLGYLASQRGDYRKALAYMVEQLRLAREIGERYSELYCLVNMSACQGNLGDFEAALHTAGQALQIARDTGQPLGEAWSLTYLGHASFALGQLTEAAASYRGAVEIFEQLNQQVLVCEPAAGLVRIALKQGDTVAARQHAGRFLPMLAASNPLIGTDEPLRVYLAGYLVLEQECDPFSAELLERAHSLLEQRAAGIPDLKTRQALLETIPHNREIQEAWLKKQIRRSDP